MVDSTPTTKLFNWLIEAPVKTPSILGPFGSIYFKYFHCFSFKN